MSSMLYKNVQETCSGSSKIINALPSEVYYMQKYHQLDKYKFANDIVHHVLELDK